MARRVFFSFYYKPDSQRAAQVRNIGAVEGNAPVSDNDWETVTSGGDAAIKRWIADQLQGKSCAVVLAGAATANRKWINYEIGKAWDDGKGVVVIHIHGLKNLAEQTSAKGANPLAYLTREGEKLSAICNAYTPKGSDSQDRYDWIKKHLSNAVEEAITIRNRY